MSAQSDALPRTGPKGESDFGEYPAVILRRSLRLMGHAGAMPLYPHIANRFANAVPGLGVVVVAASQLSHTAVWALFTLGAVGIILMVRGYRMGVRCSESEVVVFGLLHTQTIAKSAITSANTDMAGFPSLSWQTNANSRRWTPIIVFWGTSREFHVVRLTKMRRLEQLRGWLERGPRRTSA